MLFLHRRKTARNFILASRRHNGKLHKNKTLREGLESQHVKKQAQQIPNTEEKLQ